MRREFALPEQDVRYLESTRLPWETIVDQGGRWLLLHQRPVVSGYGVALAMTALQIPPSYPEAQIDMVYFHPALTRIDGKPIAAITEPTINGVTFQRWSRHRTTEGPWRPDIDDVYSHLVLVDDWLERELAKG